MECLSNPNAVRYMLDVAFHQVNTENVKKFTVKRFLNNAFLNNAFFDRSRINVPFSFHSKSASQKRY